MQVILKEDIPKLGRAGAEVKVKEGYFRNYLKPQGLALSANSSNLAALERQKESIRLKNQNQLEAAQALSEKLSAVVLNIQKEVGEENKLFGSVTNMDIAEALEKQDPSFKIDRHNIVLPEKIKALGTYELSIKLHSEVTATIKVDVLAKS